MILLQQILPKKIERNEQSHLKDSAEWWVQKQSVNSPFLVEDRAVTSRAEVVP